MRRFFPNITDQNKKEPPPQKTAKMLAYEHTTILLNEHNGTNESKLNFLISKYVELYLDFEKYKLDKEDLILELTKKIDELNNEIENNRKSYMERTENYMKLNNMLQVNIRNLVNQNTELRQNLDYYKNKISIQNINNIDNIVINENKESVTNETAISTNEEKQDIQEAINITIETKTLENTTL
jgi:molybdopterin converting factor small subunit